MSTIPLSLIAQRVRPEAPDIYYATAGASGIDLSTCEWLCLGPSDVVRVPTGWSFAIPPGYEGQVRPRSGLASEGIVAQFGTIDSDYRGEVSVILVNIGGYTAHVRPAQRIAQLVICPVTRVSIVEGTVDVSETARGAAGFGSTG